MNASSHVPRDPLFIMALPCSFSSVIGTMLGQHPQLYGLPETHLFGCNTVAEWWDASSKESFNMSHGLLRAVAQMYFDEQSDIAIAQARAWLRRRLDFTTGFLLETLAERISPRILVEKSPSIVYSRTSMDRAHSMFPVGRFIHLNCRMVASSRRFEQRIFALVWLHWTTLQLLYWCGVSPNLLSRWYPHVRHGSAKS